MHAHTTSLARQLCALLAGPALCIFLISIPPLQGLTEHGMVCMGGCAWLLVWWVTEVLPIPVTSLMAIPVFTLLGIMEPAKVFGFISHPAMMLIFGATIIVGLWKESNLIERYAYWCFNLPGIRSNPRRMLFAFTMGAGILSAIAPNIPLIILFSSIALAIVKSCNLRPEDNMTRSLFTISVFAPMLGGVGTPLGGAPNLIVIAIVSTVLGHDLSFGEWAALGMPCCVLILLGCYLISCVRYPLRTGSKFSLPEEELKAKLAKLGPVTLHEHAAIWIMVVALILWCYGPGLCQIFGFEHMAKLITAPVVAVLMGISCFLVPIRRSPETGKLVFAMNWDQAVRNIGWGIIVLQIGAIAFGAVLLEGGIDKWATGCIQKFLGNISGDLVWAALVFLTGYLSQIIMSLAIIPLMIPITAGLAQVYGFDPLLASITVGFVSNLTIMFPFSSVAVAAVLTDSGGYAQSRDFVISGFLQTTITIMIVFAFCYICGPWLLH